MFGILREYQAPTCVTHAARGRFGLPHGSWGVVFARKTSIELYVVRANETTARLELLQTTPIGAPIVSLTVLRRGASAGDILWLGFDRMRLVALTWDTNARSWVQEQKVDLGSLLGHKLCNLPDVMVGIDSADPGRKLLRGRSGAAARPVIRSDPSGRCIAVLAEKQDVLYVAPNAPEEGGGSVVNADDVFIIDLKSSYGASNVKDIVFLQGTFEPNIVVLFEPKRTWAGRAAALRRTSQLLAISVDVRSKRHSKTWVMDKLSYDCFKLEAIPESAEGGVLVLAPNVIMQVRHGACVAGLSLNCFGDAFALESKGAYDSISKSDTLMSLDAGHCRFLDWEEQGLTGNSQSTGLLSLKGGELYFLNLSFGSSNTLQMQRAGSTVLASEIVPINERFFVIASRLSDSLLIEYQKTAEEQPASASNGITSNGLGESPATLNDLSESSSASKKRPRPLDDDDADLELYGTKLSDDADGKEAEEKKKDTIELDDQDEATRGVYDDDDELGWVFSQSIEAEKASKESIKAGKWALKVKDTLPCFGPGSDLTVGLNPESPNDDDILDMVVAGGYAKNGCLAVVHQTIRAKGNFHLNLPDCVGCWNIWDPAFARQEIDDRNARNKAVERRNEDYRAKNSKRKAARKHFVDDILDKYRKSEFEAAEEKAKKEAAEKEAAEKEAAEKESTENEAEPSEADPTPSSKSEASKPATEAGDDDEEKSEPPPAPVDDAADKNGVKPPLKKVRLESGAVASPERAEDPAVPKRPEDIPIPPEVLEDAETQASAEEKFQLQPEEIPEDVVDGEADLFSHIILSTSASTVVLSTGVNLKEVDGKTIGLLTEEPTICAGNVYNKRLYVQVTRSSVRILKDGAVQCEHSRPVDASKIKTAQVLDPQILYVTEDGAVSVLSVSAEEFVESKESADEKGAADELDVDVDEYGVVLNEEKDAGTEKKVNCGSSGDKAVNGSDLKNISVSVGYESGSASSKSAAIASACLYRGSLAEAVAQDCSAPDYVVSAPVASESASEVETGAKPEAPQPTADEPKAEVKVEDVDEEDLMLYGDDADEEDLMLYGGGADDDSKKESLLADSLSNGVSTHGGQDSTSKATGNGKNGGLSSVPSEVRPIEKGVLPLSETCASTGKLSKCLLVTVTRSGRLEIRSEEAKFGVVMGCDHFFAAPTIAFDSSSLTDEKLKKKLRSPKKHRIHSVFMSEVKASAAVPGLSTPMLVAISESGFPLVYTVYMGQSKSSRMRSRLRMRRYIATDKVASLFAKSIAMTHEITKTSTAEKPVEVNFSVSHFDNMDGRSGLFVGGPCPFFVFVERGFPRIHPLYHKNPPLSPEGSKEAINRGVLAFSQLHYMTPDGNKSRTVSGFVSVADKGIIRLGELPDPANVHFDCPSPMRKVALRCTPHKVAYHAGSATYGVLASMPTLTTRKERRDRLLQSLEKHDKRHYQHIVAQAEADSGEGKVTRVPPLFEELHELRVYIAESWELKMSYKLNKGEVGLAIANMKVDVFKQRKAGAGVDIPSAHRGEDGNESMFAASLKRKPKDMLVVGTGHVNGEDATSRGRLLLFEVSRSQSISGTGAQFTQFQLLLIAQKDFSSPVTAVASMEGYVIAGVGPQVSVYKLVGEEIVHFSFAFGQLFCTSISSLKQYVVAADMRKSVSFMYFRERNASVNFLGKDFEHVTSHATEFLVRNGEMAIIMSDGTGNVHALSYAHASVPESRGGKRLLVHGGVSFGSQINKFVRVRDSQGAGAVFRNALRGGAGRHALAFTTLDGGIGMVVSADQQQFETIRSLSASLEDSVHSPRYSGIHPAEVNIYHPESASTELLGQRLCDSRGASEFFGLGTAAAAKVARELGTDTTGIARLIADLDGVLTSFG